MGCGCKNSKVSDIINNIEYIDGITSNQNIKKENYITKFIFFLYKLIVFIIVLPIALVVGIVFLFIMLFAGLFGKSIKLPWVKYLNLNKNNEQIV